MPQNMSLPSESSAYIFAPPQGALFEIADAVDAFALFLALAQYRQQPRRQNGDVAIAPKLNDGEGGNGSPVLTQSGGKCAHGLLLFVTS